MEWAMGFFYIYFKWKMFHHVISIAHLPVKVGHRCGAPWDGYVGGLSFLLWYSMATKTSQPRWLHINNFRL